MKGGDLRQYRYRLSVPTFFNAAGERKYSCFRKEAQSAGGERSEEDFFQFIPDALHGKLCKAAAHLSIRTGGSNIRLRGKTRFGHKARSAQYTQGVFQKTVPGVAYAANDPFF
ncbi:MAG TPA: hypothetical protein DCQ14_05285 [Firmicutes bacterium]|nr:hypothetical protein [Bacillota bacterium]